MSKVKYKILSVLKADTRLWNEDMTELNQTLLLDLVESIDEVVINLLLSEEELREKFFVKIKDVYVFKTNDFRFFMEENKIDNSYTAYKNKIGLTDGKKFLKYTSDVVLDFPFKDCVLEGGQSTEEGTDTYFEYSDKTEQYEQKEAKRKEIFFNQVLAKDEIDRLLDPKAFVNWKRFTKDGEVEVGEIERDEEGLIRENLVIKGNNLLVLHSLRSQYAGKVKLVYIDPPYNPPSNNNTFTYNNNYNHSTWLTFMLNRIEVAKQILAHDGAMIIAIDENEQKYLGVLLDEVFRGYENHCVTIVHNPRGVQGANFSYTHEYAYFVFPKGAKTVRNRKISAEDISFSNFRNWGSESERNDAKNCFYPIVIDKCTKQVIDFGDVCMDSYHPSVNVHDGELAEVYPIDKNGVERKWRYARQSVEEVKSLLQVVEKGGVYDIQIGKDFGQYKTVWIDKRYDANEYGTKLVKDLVPESNFSFPKSLWNVYDAIYAVVQDDRDAIILDYHAGSGTTAHAVLELNKEDGGNRRFIMIEQMDYVSTISAPRIKEVLNRNNLEDSFIYFELAKWNETAKEKIIESTSLEELEAFLDEMYEKYFLNYNLKIREFKEKVIKEERFRKLTLDEQKQIFLAMLDNNQMYVNKTEMADKKFGISEADQKLTDAFYNETK